MTEKTEKLFLCVFAVIGKKWWRAVAGCMALLLFFPVDGIAQDMAVKTNAIGWATVSPNLAFEYRVARKWTLDLSLSYNPFTFGDNKKWRHVAVQPEARYWLCAPFGGHFVGAHLLYMHYNAGNVHMPFGLWKQLRDYRFQGNLYGGGLSTVTITSSTGGGASRGLSASVSPIPARSITVVAIAEQTTRPHLFRGGRASPKHIYG